MDTSIYNCHIHTFTAEHVLPDNFLSRLLIKAMRKPWLRKSLLWLFGRLILRMNRDAVHLTGRFFARGSFESQEHVYKHLCHQYPKDTRFIVLPMDFEFMGIGTPIHPYEKQLKELAELRDNNKPNLIPFCAVDPRRPNVVEEFKRWHREYKIRGVKIYPNLGYYPYDPVLMEVYKYCEKNKLPVQAHCSPGGIRKFGLSHEEARQFANPDNYKRVLEQFPNLNFCLAHFGGAEEWERHLTGEIPSDGEGEETWLSSITDMIRSGKYPNLFTDVSYTLFMAMPAHRPFNYFNFLNVILEDPAIREHVLFGTDYYMVEREKVSEKEVSIGLRAHLGEKLYFQIAQHNPRKYLYETDKTKKQPLKTRGKTTRKQPR
ncbi:MAG: amidohydrolase family protein [Anaerolineales bacterium]|jgi:predicted TIM-barrel fold metal-dependent hydrolase|nr:amidohydrolase family protein [Anaerolineales bacterium]